MAKLICEDDIALRCNKTLLLSGAFAVHHKELVDRLIIDQRSKSGGERRLQWESLPYGPALTCMLVRPKQIITGSGDDISNFFNCLKRFFC